MIRRKRFQAYSRYILVRIQSELPVRKCAVQPLISWCDDWVTEETETNGESGAFEDHVSCNEEGRGEKRDDQRCQAQTVDVLVERRSWLQGIGKALPRIRDETQYVHQRSHLGPHGRLHRLLRLVLRRLINTLCLVLRHCYSRGYRIWLGHPVGDVTLISLGLACWILSCHGVHSDGADTSHEVAGLILHCLALVILRCSSGCIGGAKNTSLWFCDAAGAEVDQGKGCRWE